ncbi:MAG: methionine synthase [Thermoplasmata archaeon]|nr:methionine synthase [Thermoplasmata archaeon]
MKFTPNCLATGIGSLPYTDIEKACRIAIEYFPEIPFWPQLPKLSFNENMYVQYSEKIPGRVLQSDKIYIDLFKDITDELEQFYDDYRHNKISEFGQSQEYCQGLYKLLEFKSDLTEIEAIKGQITGPVSFGLQVVDDCSRPILYDSIMQDILIKNLRMKARWQEEVLSEICATTIISVDEPYLSAIGSPVFNLKREDVLANLQEVLGGIKGLKATHCCGNTDWPLLLETSIDILFLDAYSYVQNLALYPDELQEFLARGGIIGWGIVPSIAEDIQQETPEKIMRKLEDGFQLLVEKGMKFGDILHQSLITPSCGLGTLELEDAEKAISLTNEVSAIMREKYELV